jgi:hypothetical protein
MKNKKDLATAVMYVLPGTLLQELTGLYDSIPSNLLTLFGCYLIITGLNKLHGNLDQRGSQGLSFLKTAVYIFIAGALVDIIPFFGILATILYIAAFGLQLYGYVVLKSSETFGSEGKVGVQFLIISMFLALFSAFLILMPFVGGFISSYFIIFIIPLLIFGWLKIYVDIVFGKINDS